MRRGIMREALYVRDELDLKARLSSYNPKDETVLKGAGRQPNARPLYRSIRTAYFMRTDGRYRVSSGKTKRSATQRNRAMRKGYTPL